MLPVALPVAGGAQLYPEEGRSVHEGEPDVPPLADGAEALRPDVPEQCGRARLRQGHQAGGRRPAGR